MNILFVAYSHLNCNSGLHVFHLANALVELGNRCAVLVPDGKALTQENGPPDFITRDFRDFRNGADLFPAGEEPDVILAWTPREVVRQFVCGELQKQFGCPYVVHLEDNEELLFRENMGHSYGGDELPVFLSHPEKYRDFLAGAAAVSALIERLLEFKPAGLPGKVIWPGYDEIFHDTPRSAQLKSELGVPEGNHVVTYMGNCHASNKAEISSLYLAIHALNRRNIPVTLIRTGMDSVPLFDDDLAMLKDNSIELGFMPRMDLPGLLAVSDALVQPGGKNEFNDYRFPSKIPDYLVSGTDVVLPDTNIGKSLADGENCLLLERGDAIDIANKLAWLFSHPQEASAIGRAGREFAIEHLTWKTAAMRIQKLFGELLYGTV